MAIKSEHDKQVEKMMKIGEWIAIIKKHSLELRKKQVTGKNFTHADILKSIAVYEALPLGKKTADMIRVYENAVCDYMINYIMGQDEQVLNGEKQERVGKCDCGNFLFMFSDGENFQIQCADKDYSIAYIPLDSGGYLTNPSPKLSCGHKTPIYDNKQEALSALQSQRQMIEKWL